MRKTRNDPDPPAIRLAVAVKRLRVRLQEAASTKLKGLPLSQLPIIRRLRIEGPATAASLAAAEHVSQQAIAQSLAMLKKAGLVRATPDPADGRKSLIRVTDAGNRLFESAIASRNAWLLHAIDSTIMAKERPALNKAIELLERIANTNSLGQAPGEP